MSARRFETQDSRPLQLDADYSISIVATKENEVRQDAEPPVLITAAGGLSRIAVSVLPDVSYFDTCYDYWRLDLSVFVIYRNAANGREERLNAPNPISYTANEYASYDHRSAPLPSEELKRALMHIRPTIRSYAVRQLIVANVGRSVAEGILRSKLENDPSDEVKLSAAYVAARLRISELGNSILSQLKATKDGEAIRIYCWALAELHCTDAVDLLLNILLNSAYPPFGHVNYAWEYHDTPKEALIKIGPDKEASTKAREAFFKYRAWSSKVATKDQLYRYSELLEILLKYRDMKVVPFLVDLISAPEFYRSSNALYRVWSEFAIEESNSNGDRLVRDEFILALRPAFERSFDAKDPKASDEERASRFYSEPLSPRSFIFRLLCRMPITDEQLNRLLARGFKDEDMEVKVGAAQLAALLGRKEFVPKILTILDSAEKGDWSRSWLCESLEKLGTSHKACAMFKD
jgi:HEAT repeat protein